MDIRHLKIVREGNKITVEGLKGVIYVRGKSSYRVQLSLGKNAKGKYDVKRETIQGSKDDAIRLLINWNLEYLNNTLTVTNHQTVKQVYEEWIDDVEHYGAPNTHSFYKSMFEYYILPEHGHTKLKDFGLPQMQEVLKTYAHVDWHIKAAISTFISWCVDRNKLTENNCRKLKTTYKPKEKSEEDVWSIEQVKKVYSVLKFKNLYDIFIVIGIETGMRSQEILALTWDSFKDTSVVVKQAVKKRDQSDDFIIGTTKEEKVRVLFATDFLLEKLAIHKRNQEKHIAKTNGYINNNLIVADRLGGVPNQGYLRKYMARVAELAGVQYIPPKNLRSTHLSILNALGVPLPVVQAQGGHAEPSTTAKHYIRTYDETLRGAMLTLQKTLHG